MQKREHKLTAPGTKQIKKRQPSTPQDKYLPLKRANMSNPVKKKITTGNNTTDNNTQKEQAIGDNIRPKEDELELSPELQQLRELLQGDMECLLIKPLEARVEKLEKMCP